MKPVQNGEAIAYLDIGTNTARCLTAIFRECTFPEVLGLGVVPSGGVRSGLVTNTDEVAGAIRQPIEQAERYGELFILLPK